MLLQNNNLNNNNKNNNISKILQSASYIVTVEEIGCLVMSVQ